MDRLLQNLDWTLVKSFLAVAETGSLSGAARQLGTSQPTLGRQIKTIESQLGAELFQRQPRGLTLTQTGADLLVPAQTMRNAAQQITLTAAGQQDRLNGTVRITASVALAVLHLPQIIAHIRQLEPEIMIELVASDQSDNLLYRAADIAVRMYRPKQLELVTQHLGDLPLGMFAANSYIAKRGMPGDDLLAHDFIGYDSNLMIIDGFAQAGFKITRDFFKVRCDDNIAYMELIRSGCGIGFLQTNIGQADTNLTQLDPGFPLLTLPIWLTAHEKMRQTPRIRRVWGLLADGLRPLVS